MAVSPTPVLSYVHDNDLAHMGRQNMMVRDPVSGVWLEARTAVATREHGGNLLYFESKESVELFDDDPHYYGHPDADEEHSETHHASHTH